MHFCFWTYANLVLKQNMTDFLLHAWLAAASVSLSTSARCKVELHSSLFERSVKLTFDWLFSFYSHFMKPMRSDKTVGLHEHSSLPEIRKPCSTRQASQQQQQQLQRWKKPSHWSDVSHVLSVYCGGAAKRQQSRDAYFNSHMMPKWLVSPSGAPGPRVMRFKEVAVRGGCLSPLHLIALWHEEDDGSGCWRVRV